MPKFLIERTLPQAGELSPTELHGMSAVSNKVVSDLGPEIKWLHSFVTEDKIYCVYVAPDEDILYEHARCAGFPIDLVTQVAAEIDPATGD
jgi:hypothetical protein